ncbi:hypothetical protein FLONG3_6533 [Fusarium longipes]|uniref:F-box domain-containing protein n=1 Tax=Fusarium longipes TaxID=694270 RepID=A0A395SL94_9HYPO|nr:hypothetical protein FLONG3_6533 [Fusarium longipes]
MPLSELPREILTEIFSLDHGLLHKKDLLSARLTCRELAQILTPILYHTIRISPLIQDRDEFLKIARQPHLACHVRVIIWEELNGDLSQLDPVSWHNGLPVAEHPFFEDLTANAKELFWLKETTTDFYPQYAVRPVPTDLAEFKAEFLDVIDSMPNLCTFVSKPMNPRREIKLPSMDYVITVLTITNYIHKDVRSGYFNFGFHFFLVPALELLAQKPAGGRSSPKITNLLYADEGAPSWTSLIHLESSLAFSTIEHLDLCIAGKSNYNVITDLLGFFNCFQNAPNLTTLTICQETHRNETIYGRRTSSIINELPTLPKLTEVHFFDIAKNEDEEIRSWTRSIESEFGDHTEEEIGYRYVLERMARQGTLEEEPMDDEDEQAASYLAPVQFIKRHAKTLKSVYISSSGICKQVLKQLKSLRTLQLERFVIVSGDDFEGLCHDYHDYEKAGKEKHKHIDEQVILDYINRDGKCPPWPSIPYGGADRRTELHTHDAIFDNNDPMDAAVFDTRGPRWQERGYDFSDVQLLDSKAFDRRDENGLCHSIGAGRIEDAKTGLWVDYDGVYYDPRTDEEISNPAEICPSTNEEWTKQGKREWNPERGLWRDAETGSVSKFAVDRERLKVPNLRDYEPWTNDDSLDMQPVYDEEEELHLLRVEGAPRWDWGRDEDGKIWYWQTRSSTGHVTEMWRFEHKGEYAYGNDPLEFWDDYYNEAGDDAEATPFGWNLSLFSLRSKECGSEIPNGDVCKGLTEYTRSKDPMFEEETWLGTGSWWKYIPAPIGIDLGSEEDWYSVFDSAAVSLKEAVRDRGYYETQR